MAFTITFICTEEFYINRIKLLLLTFLILTLSSGIGAAIEVHQGGSIQAAVNSANPQGDTIIVYPGTYTENIDIKISNLVLKSATGNASETIIVPSDINKSVITATSKNLEINGFTINGAATDKSGIYLDSSRDCIIQNNNFVNDALGVYVKSSVNTTIRNNLATRTGEAGKVGRGINVESCEITTVSNNIISNQRYGVYFDKSAVNTISGNSISQCTDDGMRLMSSNKSTVESNTVSSNGARGIYLKNTVESYVKNNIVSSNGANGIDLELSSGNTVMSNMISGNAKDTNIHGLFVNTSKNDYLENNTISNCQYGVAMRYSESNNFVSNNAFENDIGYYVSYTSSRNSFSANKANSNNIGIVITGRANNNIIDRNEVNSNSASGIALDDANNNKISNNSASSNSRGIYLLSLSSKNTISDNTVNSNRNDGIILENTNENDVTNNIVSSNKRYGISMVNSNYSKLIKNTAQNNVRGISLEKSSNNTVYESVLTGCSGYGLYLDNSSNNNLSRNVASSNGEGISLSSSESNKIIGNKVESNGRGIFMCSRSIGNQAYDNCFNNVNNAEVRNNKSFWNTDKISGKNIMGGPTLGGNFWGTPAGLGFSDVNSGSDAEGDGIIDIPFISANGNIIDNYPLARIILPVANFNANPTKGFAPLTVEFRDLSQDATSISWDVNDDGKPDSNNSTFVYVYNEPGTYNAKLTASNKNGTAEPKIVQIIAEKYIVYPVADLSASPMNGYAPLSVQFTDLSQNATSRNWDIGNDGTIESTNASFAYVFSVPGNYPVSLIAINENGTSSKAATIIVSQQSNSGGGSSGGSHKSGGSGGGGGGGSPESAKNIQVKEISQTHVASGKPVKFDFTKNATCVVYVSFDAKKTAGKTTTIAEQLKGKSAQVSNLSTGEVYKYFNLWVGNAGFATEKNIENPVVCFKVEKSWLQDKKIDQNSITLNRYSDKKWSELPVKLLREDNKYLYLTANTPGFTYFAITGKAAEKPTADTKPETDTSELEENNTTVTETEKDQNLQQETGKGKISSIPGFEGLFVVACLITLFLHKKK